MIDVPNIQYAVCSERLQKPYAYNPFTGAVDTVAELQQRLHMPVRLELAPHTLGVSLAELTPERREWMAKYAQEADVHIDAIHWAFAGGTQVYGVHGRQPNLVHPQEGRDFAVSYLNEAQKFLYELRGGKRGGVIVVGSPAQRKIPECMTKEEAYSHAANVLNVALETTDYFGVVIAPEMLTPEEDNFCTTPDDYADLLAIMNNGRIVPMGDNKAIVGVGADPAKFVRRFWPLRRYHVNEPDRNLPGFPGGVYDPEHAYDFKDVFYALLEQYVRRTVNPTNCRVSIEHFVDPKEGEILDNLEKSIRFLQEHEEIAREALATDLHDLAVACERLASLI